jgi:tetratricopeptide (TPR) repeat protein
MACGLAAAPWQTPVSARAPAQRAVLDALLAAYVAGDDDAIARTLPRSGEFQALRVADTRRLERWLGPKWERPKAGLVIELAEVSTRVAPAYTRFFLDAGRGYILRAEAARALAPSDAAFVRLWHRAALGMLQGGAHAGLAEAYLQALYPNTAADAEIDPRLLLARAIATEQRCWLRRPILDDADVGVANLMKAARLTVRDPAGPSGPQRANREDAYRTCLQRATDGFAAAARAPETRAEAQVRLGWMQFQLGQVREAFESLDRADAGEDTTVAYWAALFRGRVLDGLRRHADAAEQYRLALAVAPAAQSATVGLTLALFRSDRTAEADELAREYRSRESISGDPWWDYATADRRFVAGWLRQVRSTVR